MIQFKCPRCGAKMSVPGEMAGRAETCPECSHACRVPESSAAGGSGCPTSGNQAAHNSPGRPPTYAGATLISCFLVAVGVVSLIPGAWIILKTVGSTPERLESELRVLVGLVAVTAGCLDFGLAFGLYCLCDIARNTFRPREG